MRAPRAGQTGPHEGENARGETCRATGRSHANPRSAPGHAVAASRRREVIRLLNWKEIYLARSADAEAVLLTQMAETMIGSWQAELNKGGARQRLMFAKTVAGFEDASLVLDPLLPAEAAVAHFKPGSAIPASVRWSNSSHVRLADSAPDVRGCAVRLSPEGGSAHDLLFANVPTSMARNAEQFFEFFKASRHQPDLLFAHLAGSLGERESRRIAAWLKNSFRLCASLASESYWSGCALLWGDRPARLKLTPFDFDASAVDQTAACEGLGAELISRLKASDIKFRLAVQSFVNERVTPIEDAAIDWSERVSPFIEFATLVVRQRTLSTAQFERTSRRMDAAEFNLWNAPAEFRPLGSLNRLRRLVYPLAAELRQAAD